jgi:hypothetical protein
MLDNPTAWVYSLYMDTTATAGRMTRSQVVRASYPEAYYIAGIGWCGANWQAAMALETILRAAEEAL